MRYFTIERDPASRYTGEVDAAHRWGLPGVSCPVCKVTWALGSLAYPSVDLTPVASLADFEEARAEPLEEYERLCGLVRPLLPPGALLRPGTGLGPLTGKAQGRFGALAAASPWGLLAQRQVLELLQAEGLQGLRGCRTALRFRQRGAPELLELEVLPVGRLHPDCLPAARPPPCPRCTRQGLSLPEALLLDEATLPRDMDLFRLEDFSTVLVCTERLVRACERLGAEGVVFQPVAVRGRA